MGAGVPYAIGAKFAHPDRPVIAPRRQRRYADEQHGRTNHRPGILEARIRPTLDVCVFNNQDLNEVTRERRVMEGNPRFDASQTFLTSLTQNSGRCSV